MMNNVNERLVRQGLFTWPSDSPRLIGGRCPQCYRYFFPARSVCPDCFQMEKLETVELSDHGVLYTFCVLHQAPLGFDPPYAVGFVELPEKLRIYSFIDLSSSVKLNVGMRMELVVGPLRRDHQGTSIIGYRFYPKEK